MDYTAFPAWPDVAARLIAVAAGREPADCVIRGGVWVNVHSRECLPGHDIAIAEGRIHGEAHGPKQCDRACGLRCIQYNFKLRSES